MSLSGKQVCSILSLGRFSSVAYGKSTWTKYLGTPSVLWSNGPSIGYGRKHSLWNTMKKQSEKLVCQRRRSYSNNYPPPAELRYNSYGIMAAIRAEMLQLSCTAQPQTVSKSSEKPLHALHRLLDASWSNSHCFLLRFNGELRPEMTYVLTGR